MNYLLHTLNIIFSLQLSLSQQDIVPDIVIDLSSNSITSNPTTPSPATSSLSTIARLYQPAPCLENNALDCVGVSPCTYTTCPAYPNAICRIYNCGRCSAIFIDPITGNELSYRECIYKLYEFSILSTPSPTDPSPTDPSPTLVTGDPSPTDPSPTDATQAPLDDTIASTTKKEEEAEEEEGSEYEYPFQVDQYQKTRDNYGVNLNDEMIDIGEDLINYGDLDIDVAWPYTLQSLSNAITNHKVVSPEEIGDDPVVNGYTIDNVQKTRDNMGLNLNDEVVDIGRNLINYGRLHYRMVPVSESGVVLTPNNDANAPSTPAFDAGIVCEHDGNLWKKICADGSEVSAAWMDDCQIIPCPVSESDAGTGAVSTPILDTNIPSTPVIDADIPCGQDTKICADGTVVVRQSMDNCKFTACPIDTLIDTVNTDIVPPQSARLITEEQQLAPSNHVEIENGNKNTTENMTKLIIVGIFLLIIFGVLPLLYWCYCKQCTLPNTKIEPRREVLDDIEN